MTQDSNTDETDIVEQFRQMDEDEREELLRTHNKYPASIGVLEAFEMIGIHFNDAGVQSSIQLNIPDDAPRFKDYDTREE